MASEQGAEMKASGLSAEGLESYSGAEADVEDESNAHSGHATKGGRLSPALIQKFKGKNFGGGTGDKEGTHVNLQSGDPGSRPVSSEPKEIDKGAPLNDELGTGYEEDTEPGSLSSESETVPQSANRNSSTHSPSVFKAVEGKDESELTLDDIRTSKTKLDDVKAPGIVGRAVEELEAVSDGVLETLHLKSSSS